MILGANHVAMSVPDLDRAVAFYCELLAFEKAGEFGWPAGFPAADQILGVSGTAARVVHLRTTNLLLELFEFSAGNPASQDPDRPVVDHGITHLCLAVTDLDGEYARLTAAGMRFHCPPTAVVAGVRTTYGRDPFGNVIELEEMRGRVVPHQPATDAVPGTGTLEP
jgi:catechol 2,3-dioxygenase-like lactoylglutathione lyase family enzyme